MSYDFNWTTPGLQVGGIDQDKDTITASINTTETASTSLTLTGKGLSNYGLIQQNNLLHILESFAAPAEPVNPTVGQLWYDTSIRRLKVLTRKIPTHQWRVVGDIHYGPTPPTEPDFGFLWLERTGPTSGYLYIYTGLGRYGSPTPLTTVGGWEQVWPQVTMTAGRDEFDDVRVVVENLIRTPTAVGDTNGSGALDRAITYLPDFSALDNDMRTKWDAAGRDPITATLAPGDTLISGNPAEMKVDPNSQDWDRLLAAGRHAIERLDLPQTPHAFYKNVSSFPFVHDGRQAPAELLALDPTAPDYPGQGDEAGRRTSRKMGVVTMANLYAGTGNALGVAYDNRFSIKGINGAGGANPAFDPTTIIRGTRRSIRILDTDGATEQTLKMRYTFDSAIELQRFINCAGFFQVTITHGAGNSVDNNLAQLTVDKGVVRVCGDRARAYDTTNLVTQISSVGLNSISTTSNAGTTHLTMTLGPSIIRITGYRPFPEENLLDLEVGITAGGTTAAQTIIEFAVVDFSNIYSLGFVYPHAQDTVPADLTGSFMGTNEPAGSPIPIPPPIILTHPMGGTYNSGNLVNLSVVVTGVLPITYQWESSTNMGGSWDPIIGAVSSTFSFTASGGDDGKWFRCVVTNAGGSVTSTHAEIDVYVGAPVVTPPTDITVFAGTVGSFTVSATGITPFTYQWERSTTGGLTWDPIGGAVAATYVVPAGELQYVNNSDLYRCLVTNIVTTTASDPAELTILPYFSIDYAGQAAHFVSRNNTTDPVPIVHDYLFSPFSSPRTDAGAGWMPGLAVETHQTLIAGPGPVTPIVSTGVVGGTGQFSFTTGAYGAVDGLTVLQEFYVGTTKNFGNRAYHPSAISVLGNVFNGANVSQGAITAYAGSLATGWRMDASGWQAVYSDSTVRTFTDVSYTIPWTISVQVLSGTISTTTNTTTGEVFITGAPVGGQIQVTWGLVGWPGYTYVKTVNVAQDVIGVTSVTMNSNGSYASLSPAPAVVFDNTGTGGSGAAGTAIMASGSSGGDFMGTVSDDGVMSSRGLGYTSTPSVTINQPGLTSGPGLSVASIVMGGVPGAMTPTFLGGGGEFASVPDGTYSGIINGITAYGTYAAGFTEASFAGGASATVQITVTSNVVTGVVYTGGGSANGERVFAVGDIVSISSGFSIAWHATINSISSVQCVVDITFNGAGSSTFSSIPTLSFAPPGAGNQAAGYVVGNYTPIVTTYFVSGVTMTNNGSGYATPPLVTFSGGNSPSPAATGTAVIGPV